MKNLSSLRFLLLSLFFATAFVACSDDNKDNGPGGDDDNKPASGIWVLNQGSYGGSNASLSHYNLETEEVTEDVFFNVNGRKLGELAQDIKCYGSLMYITVSGSGSLEVVNKTTGSSVKQIAFTDESDQPREPRRIACAGGNVYVTMYDGFVARIDTISLTVEDYVAVGRNPEGIAVYGNRLFVANSGGMGYPDNFDNTVSVIDISVSQETGKPKFTETGKTTVADDPIEICATEYGDIYVISRADYTNPILQRISTATTEITTIHGFKAYSMSIAGKYAYIYNYDYDTMESSYTLYNVIEKTVERGNLITDDTDIPSPYYIGADAATGDFFVSNGVYNSNGDLYIFNKNGKYKTHFDTGGVYPCGIAIH